MPKYILNSIPLVAAVALAGCGGTHNPEAPDGGMTAVDASVADASTPVTDAPTLRGLRLLCKLISDRNIDAPTPNQTHTRANVRGTDLGIPVAHDNELYLFFGDTAGAHGIWPFGVESLPDAVGYAAVPYAHVAADPSLLCSELRFLLTAGATAGAEGDFAGAYMIPPAGIDVGQFVHNPAGPRGAALFPNLPGDFEVPSGGFSHGGSVYLFYTVVDPEPLEMRGSYLARWGSPSTTALPNYDILYSVDQRFDDDGALGGDFINIAALVGDEYLYLYGTGQYRASPVHLARKPLVALQTPGGFQRYDAASDRWLDARAAVSPIVPDPHLGELSVRYFPGIERYVMLDQESAAENRIVARFAEAPEGPWSQPVTVASMSDPEFSARHCCAGSDCSGERLFECEHAGFYAAYMLPDATLNRDGSFSISFVLSTWKPYNVALMTATFDPR